MTLLYILGGIVGLSILIVIHELGHYWAARAMGMKVDAFSLGWGPVLISKQWKGTNFRVSAIPMGGYCRVNGEVEYAEAMAAKNSDFVPEPGSFYSKAPWRRLVVVLAGPLINLLLAVLLLSILNLFPEERSSYSNQIVVPTAQEQLGSAMPYPTPAMTAGLQDGDRIVAIDQREMKDFSAIAEYVALNPERSLSFTLERDGSLVELQVTPALDSEVGRGMVGIRPWIELVIGQSSDDESPFRPGDTIIALDQQPLNHIDQLSQALESSTYPAELMVDRNGQQLSFSIQSLEQAQDWLTIAPPEVSLVPGLPLGAAMVRGFVETGDVIAGTIRSLGFVFSGRVSAENTVGGPLRISYLLGASAGQQLESNGIAAATVTFVRFMALISLALFIGNLLPIPVLDGGKTVLYLIEMIAKKPASPRAVYWYQVVGLIMVGGIIVFSLINDIQFIAQV